MQASIGVRKLENNLLRSGRVDMDIEIALGSHSLRHLEVVSAIGFILGALVVEIHSIVI